MSFYVSISQSTLKINPSNIRFSQPTISEGRKFDAEKYQSILVIQMDDDNFISFDNRRLYIARAEGLSELQCYVKHNTEIIPNPIRFPRYMAWNGFISEQETSHILVVYVLECQPKNYSSLIFTRTGQYNNFPLMGRFDVPDVITPRPGPHRIVAEDSHILGRRDFNTADSMSLFERALQSPDEANICIGVTEGGGAFFPLSGEYIKLLRESSLSDLFHILGCGVYLTAQLKAAGDPKDWNFEDWAAYDLSMEVEESLDISLSMDEDLSRIVIDSGLSNVAVLD